MVFGAAVIQFVYVIHGSGLAALSAIALLAFSSSAFMHQRIGSLLAKLVSYKTHYLSILHGLRLWTLLGVT
jgi:hypothetical protein